MAQDDVYTVVKYCISRGKKPGESISNIHVSELRLLNPI